MLEVPVNVGDENIVDLLSFVTFPRPTCVAVTPLTVPVNVGDENIVDLLSFVTFDNPTCDLVKPLTVIPA